MPAPGVNPAGRAARASLVPGDSGTLYLRDIPDAVVTAARAAGGRDGVSVGEVAVRELGEASRRADNPVLLGSLPDLGMGTAMIVADLEAGRAGQ